MDARSDIAGIILAGGNAARMGGGDKPLLDLSGRPLLAHVVARLEPQCARLAINANGDAARFSSFGLPVVADTLDGRPGPLAGVLAGLEWARRRSLSHVVTAAGDTPFLPANLVAGLAAMVTVTGRRIVIARSDGRDHPVFALWPVDLADDLASFIETGTSRSVRAFAVDRHDAAYAEFPIDNGLDPFFNVNTPDDLAAARQLSEKGRP